MEQGRGRAVAVLRAGIRFRQDQDVVVKRGDLGRPVVHPDRERAHFRAQVTGVVDPDHARPALAGQPAGNRPGVADIAVAGAKAAGHCRVCFVHRVPDHPGQLEQRIEQNIVIQPGDRLV